jgi:hypothetical protein
MANGGRARDVGSMRDWAHIEFRDGRETREQLVCVYGADNCRRAGFVEAARSDFHDEALVEATRKLNAVIAEIPKDDRGRTLAFLNTRHGTFLAWMTHDGVNSYDDDDAVAKALKLKVKRRR